jgi:hypothetical protein
VHLLDSIFHCLEIVAGPYNITITATP